MADIPAGGPYAGPDRADYTTQGRESAVKSLGTFANYAGAAVSLALIVGVSVWGYKMLARDVSGVPVVRAASGKPMKVQPEDPGGRPALHQGLAVNKVAAIGVAEAPADKLILAPAPVDLSEDDAAMGTVVAADVVTAPKVEPVAATAPKEGVSPQMTSIRALADKLSAGADPLEKTEQAEPETVQTVAAVVPPKPEPAPEPAVAKPEIKGGLKSSLRPVLRPGGLKATPAAVAAPQAEAALEVEPASIPAGTRLAQLGAFESPEIARQEWDRLGQRFGDYLEGKQRIIQKAQSGGRTFYRLRAMGFADLNDARRFCSALVAERADCIPVTTR